MARAWLTRPSTWLLLGGPTLCFPIAAWANMGPEPQSAPLEELVVTAEKRPEGLQRAPLAVSAVRGEALDRLNIDTVADLPGVAPGLYVARQDGQALISIRGIGSNVVAPGADSGVAVHLDGVYIAKQQAQDAALFDVERVEVLRGPQGTVNGRNATGGAINVVTRRPTGTAEGYLNLTVGNYAAVKASGALSGPLRGEQLTGRLAFRTEGHDGYTPNQGAPGAKAVDDARQRSLRTALRLQAGPRLDWQITADYDRIDTRGFATLVRKTASGAPVPGTLAGGVLAQGRAINADGPTGYDRETYGVTSSIVADLGAARLTSLTSYRRLDDRVRMDIDGTNRPVLNDDLQTRQWQVSQEVTLASRPDGRLHWLAGLYHFRDLQRPTLEFERPAVSVLAVGGVAKTWSWAAYAQADYQVSPRLRVTAGGRYARDRKSAFEFLTLRPPALQLTDQLGGAWSAFTPKLSIDYTPAPGRMFYATATRGFRSGGINVGNLQGSTFEPEFVWNYEAGFKGAFLKGRLEVSSAVFHDDYSNIQLYNIRAQTGVVENAASATIEGAEFELRAAPAAGWTLTGAATYLDARLDAYDTVEPARPAAGRRSFAGNPLARAPRWTANAAVERRWDALGGEIALRGEYRYASRINFTEFNRPETQEGAVGLVNVRASYAPHGARRRVTAFVENLTDTAYNSNVLVGSATTSFTILEYPAPPRTVGVMLSAMF